MFLNFTLWSRVFIHALYTSIPKSSESRLEASLGPSPSCSRSSSFQLKTAPSSLNSHFSLTPPLFCKQVGICHLLLETFSLYGMDLAPILDALFVECLERIQWLPIQVALAEVERRPQAKLAPDQALHVDYA